MALYQCLDCRAQWWQKKWEPEQRCWRCYPLEIWFSADHKMQWRQSSEPRERPGDEPDAPGPPPGLFDRDALAAQAARDRAEWGPEPDD